MCIFSTPSTLGEESFHLLNFSRRIEGTLLTGFIFSSSHSFLLLVTVNGSLLRGMCMTLALIKLLYSLISYLTKRFTRKQGNIEILSYKQDTKNKLNFRTPKTTKWTTYKTCTATPGTKTDLQRKIQYFYTKDEYLINRRNKQRELHMIRKQNLNTLNIRDNEANTDKSLHAEFRLITTISRTRRNTRYNYKAITITANYKTNKLYEWRKYNFRAYTRSIKNISVKGVPTWVFPLLAIFVFRLYQLQSRTTWRLVEISL